MTVYYVLGFAFTSDLKSALLILKNRPPWQAGLLNGVGGKVEPGEKPLDAMVREFKEESHIDTTPEQWRHFATLAGDDFLVLIYATVTDDVLRARTMTDEALYLISTERSDTTPPLVPNLKWLLPLALDEQVKSTVLISIK